MKTKTQHTKNIDAIVQSLGIDTTQYWINLLKTIPDHELGIIKASGKLLSEPILSQMCEEIAYLGEKKFYLPLVIGGGVQYDQLSAYKAAGKVNELRITGKDLLEQIVPLAKLNQDEVVSRLKEAGVNAVAVPFASNIVEPHGPEIDKEGNFVETHFVGDVINIDTKPIMAAIYEGIVPVISHIGVYNGQLYNANATDVAVEVAKFMGSKKMIILGDKPILDQNKNHIKRINSEQEYLRLKRLAVINKGMITNCDQAYELLDYLGPGHCVQITCLKENTEGITSTGLLEELLGNGSGTKLTVPPLIKSMPLYRDDHEMLEKMINSVFIEQDKMLKKSYFDTIKTKDPTVYLDALQKGGAITYPMQSDGASFEYLCKLFTLKDYEGMGIASSIISTVSLQKGSLAWRADKKNPGTVEYYKNIVADFNGFTEPNCNYVVFGINIPEEKKAAVIKTVSEVPASLVYLG